MSEEQTPQDPGGLKMDFSTFILSLNASSLIHLGEIHDPQLKEISVNLPAAKHTIEILEILKELRKKSANKWPYFRITSKWMNENWLIY